jgi:chromosome segregation ATPase
MAKLEDLAERVDRLVLRHQELKRTSALIEQQLSAVTAERDSLRSRLAAARARIDALLERLPTDSPAAPPGIEKARDKAPEKAADKARKASAG